MREQRLDGRDGFPHQIPYLAPQRVDVVSLRSQVLPQRRERALRAFVVRLRVHEVGAVFVERVVGEVHRLGSQVGRRRLLVARGCEPRDALLVHVHRQRVHAGDQRVDAQVELEPVHQKRRRDVLLHHHRALVLVVDPVGASHEVNAAAHGAGGGLHDVAPPGMRLAVLAERCHLVGVLPSVGREVVRPGGAGGFHSLQVAAQRGFAADLHHPGEVIHALKREHLRHAMLADAEVRPVQVPVLVLVVHLLVPVLLRHLAHGLVLAARQVRAELRRLESRRGRLASAPGRRRRASEVPLGRSVPHVIARAARVAPAGDARASGARPVAPRAAGEGEHRPPPLERDTARRGVPHAGWLNTSCL